MDWDMFRIGLIAGFVPAFLYSFFTELYRLGMIKLPWQVPDKIRDLLDC